jgi:hypothetical protein
MCQGRYVHFSYHDVRQPMSLDPWSTNSQGDYICPSILDNSRHICNEGPKFHTSSEIVGIIKFLHEKGKTVERCQFHSCCLVFRCEQNDCGMANPGPGPKCLNQFDFNEFATLEDLAIEVAREAQRELPELSNLKSCWTRSASDPSTFSVNQLYVIADSDTDRIHMLREASKVGEPLVSFDVLAGFLQSACDLFQLKKQMDANGAVAQTSLSLASSLHTAALRDLADRTLSNWYLVQARYKMTQVGENKKAIEGALARMLWFASRLHQIEFLLSPREAERVYNTSMSPLSRYCLQSGVTVVTRFGFTGDLQAAASNLEEKIKAREMWVAS